MSSPARAILAAIVATGTFLALASCSTGSPQKTVSRTTSTSPTSDGYITARDLNAKSISSPARTVLRFWQDIQLQDYPGALTLLTPTFVTSYASNLDHFTKYVSAEQAHWLVKPTVQATTVTGNDARVVVVYLFGGTLTPASFDLKRVNGQWLISYSFYLINRLTAGRS